MRLRWTERAAREVEAIQNHIATESPGDAEKLVGDIIEHAEQIREFPRSGRAVPEYDQKEIREFLHNSYRVVYLVDESTVQVLTVRHAARLLPDEPPIPD